MKYSVFLVLFFFVAGCKDAKKNDYKTIGSRSTQETAVHPGKRLMETHCYVCHSPTTDQQTRIAPPLVAIKVHYINEDTSKEDFVAQVSAFVNGPTAEKAKLRGAVRKFGVMPYMPYPEKDIAQIAEYMYGYQIEEPEWFKEHWESRPRGGTYQQTGKIDTLIRENPQNDYEKIGLQYALSTKQELGKNLMGTIQKKGTLAALEFCNVQAYPLTDSMSVVHNAKIRRVSDKPRNPNNRANEEELGYIETFKYRIASGKEVSPLVKTANGKVHFYYPITTNTMCLQCHGKPNEQIKPATLTALEDLYPADKAQGYDVNELRGIWSIVFDEKTKE